MWCSQLECYDFPRVRIKETTEVFRWDIQRITPNKPQLCLNTLLIVLPMSFWSASLLDKIPEGFWYMCVYMCEMMNKV